MCKVFLIATKPVTQSWTVINETFFLTNIFQKKFSFQMLLVDPFKLKVDQISRPILFLEKMSLPNKTLKHSQIVLSFVETNFEYV